MRGVLCASPQYIQRHGMPASISELQKHTCVPLITPDGSLVPWKFDGFGETAPLPSQRAPVTSDSPDALAEVLAAGMGIGILPAPTATQCFKRGTLVHVLHETPLAETNVHALYASREFLDAKIRRFIEFMRNTFDERTEHEEPASRRSSSMARDSW
ncbi:LysR substrate-binding domain-containing protein [Burkholderia vietnamiensis]|uniref:LysR substrate-binding domain-containing protein n=1 Tax=Burkholderia vietnamiensis TaxID=60552 RepID=UPI003D15F913